MANYGGKDLNLIFLSREGRDLGVAFQTHLVSQALSRGADQRPNPCLLNGRRTLYHRTTREAPLKGLLHGKCDDFNTAWVISPMLPNMFTPPF